MSRKFEEKKKILITSIGSLVGQNILEVLHKRNINISIIGTNSIANAPVYGCDRIYLVPESNLNSSDFICRLSNIIKIELPDLIIPGRDIDVTILSIIKKDFKHKQVCFLVGEQNLAELMEDKIMSYQFARKEGLPFAETVICDLEKNKKAIDQLVDNFGFPLILKPMKGFASKNVTLVFNQDQLKRINSSNMILQEYLGNIDRVVEFEKRIKVDALPLYYSLEDTKFSFQFFIDQSGNLKGKCSTVHNMQSGASLNVELNFDKYSDHIINLFYKAFQRNGWFGPINIQMQKSFLNGKLKAYEFNGRFTGATAARYFLGYDEVGLAMEEVQIKSDKDERFRSQITVTKIPVVSVIPEIRRISLEEKRELDN